MGPEPTLVDTSTGAPSGRSAGSGRTATAKPPAKKAAPAKKSTPTRSAGKPVKKSPTAKSAASK